ncbi:hypothetical protein LINPERHAP2_LOCUS16286, partial [Linum perenne]
EREEKGKRGGRLEAGTEIEREREEKRGGWRFFLWTREGDGAGGAVDEGEANSADDVRGGGGDLQEVGKPLRFPQRPGTTAEGAGVAHRQSRLDRRR